MRRNSTHAIPDHRHDDGHWHRGDIGPARRRALHRLALRCRRRRQEGTKFDSSKDRNEPFEFGLGAGEVIRGWDEGVKGHESRRQARADHPADMGYGARGAGGVIPPNATLLFEVELLEVR